MPAPLAAIGPGALDPAEVVRLVSVDEHGVGTAVHGAVVAFIGTARAQSQGRTVLRLEYEAYEPLAVRAFGVILDEAGARWPSARIAFRHRTGPVALGEASVVIAAASPHRAEAFAACRYVIERIKQIAPIWKREFFEEGDVWVEGATCDPADVQAREEAYRRACA